MSRQALKKKKGITGRKGRGGEQNKERKNGGGRRGGAVLLG